MYVQKKLFPCFDRDFWKDLPTSVSFLVRDLINGRDIPRIAARLREAGVGKCSDSLLYKWANPNDEQQPSLKAFLLLIKITENCEPLDLIIQACGKKALPEERFGAATEALKALVGALEGE